MATGSAISAHNPRGLHRDGWSLLLSSQLAPPLDDIVTSAALGAACGAAGVRVRQSMHADTWLASAGGDEVFVKIIRAPEGLVRLKRMVRGSIAMHVAAITASLQRDGFRAPLPVLWGYERRGGREIIATMRAKGVLLPRLMREWPHGIAAKRSMLRALGAEIARLHRAGYIHGDLTPFNVIVAEPASAPTFIFLDHERTRRTPLARLVRPRLRNLVQLGRFALTGVTKTDRMRVWRGYVDAGDERRARHRLRRLARMIRARVTRDGLAAGSDSKPMLARRRVGET